MADSKQPIKTEPPLKVLDPQHALSQTLQYLDALDALGALGLVPYGSDSLNTIFRPQIPMNGEMESALGATGAGKTQWVDWRVREEAKRLLKLEDDNVIPFNSRNCVVHVGLEETVEAKYLADQGYNTHQILTKGLVDRKDLRRRMQDHANLPIFRIGKSSMLKNGAVVFKDIVESIKWIQKEGWNITMLALDHINDLHHTTIDDQRKATEESANALVRLAEDNGIFILIAVQAKAEVYNKSFPDCIPDTFDASWSSKIPQLAARNIGLYRPIEHTTRYEEGYVEWNYVRYDITPNLLFLRVPKARENNPYDKIIPTLFYPKEGRLELHPKYLAKLAQNGAR